VRGVSLDSTTYSGADSTDANARSLAWFNARAKPGDVCLMKSAPQGNAYPSLIQPVNSGSAGNLISYVGDLAQPYSRVVSGVAFDSSLGVASGWQYISVKGVGMPGDAKITVANNTACHDSILNCTIDGSWSNHGGSGAVLRYCRVGTGDATDKFDEAHGNTANYFQWVTGTKVLDNTFNLACGAKDHDGNAMTHMWSKSGAMLRNRTTYRKLNSAFGDAHLNTWYSCSDFDVTDCRFEGSASGLSGPNGDAEYYILNLRDNQVANRWVRDTLVELNEPNAVRPLKFAWMTAGDTDPAHEAGSHNNLFDSNVVKIRGFMEYQDISRGDIHRFNTYITGEQVNLAGCQTGCTTQANDSLTFTHNTVVSLGGVVISDNKVTNSRVTQNIFYAAAARNGGHVGYFGSDPAGTLGPADSNLVWCQDPRDSTHALSAGAISGGWSVPLRSAYLLNDQHSYWADPVFADTSSLYTFNAAPKATGMAYSSNLWPDGFVGALNLTPDVTPPVVNVSAPAPASMWNAGDYMTITWTSTDAGGLYYANVQYNRVTEPGVWRSIKMFVQPSSTYVWRLPNLAVHDVTIRVTVFDLAGNSTEAPVAIAFGCAPCEDEHDPYLDPFGP
jgi:hypothetical protein